MKPEAKALWCIAVGVILGVGILIGSLAIFGKATMELPDVSIRGPLGMSMRSDNNGGWLITGRSYDISTKGAELMVVVEFVPYPGKTPQGTIYSELSPAHPRIPVAVDRSVTKETRLLVSKTRTFSVNLNRVPK